MRSTRDAYRVCAALDHAKAMLPTEREAREMVSTPLHVVTGLFQEVKTEAAYRVLSQKGLPILNEVVQESLYGGRFIPGQDILFILKVMAAYRFRPVVRHLAAALRKELEPDHYLWPVLFAHFAEPDHPQALALVEKLGHALPPRSPGIGLLHLGNVLAERAQIFRHPFSAELGRERLGALLSGDESILWEDAMAATTALAFVDPNWRPELLDLARQHGHPRVRLEAQGVQALEGHGGAASDRVMNELLDHAKNPRYSRQAVRLLRRAGAESTIPGELEAAEFQALADLSEHLENTGRFPGPPDDLQLFDTRSLCWPPALGESICSLCEFRYRQDDGQEAAKGMALVNGHVTVYMEQAINHLNVDDLYAFFCFYEATLASVDEVNVTECIARGRTLLNRHHLAVAESKA